MLNARTNEMALEACPQHRFEWPIDIDGEGDRTAVFMQLFGKRFKCRRCGGEMEPVNAFRYAQGAKSAGGDPNLIIPGVGSLDGSYSGR